MLALLLSCRHLVYRYIYLSLIRATWLTLHLHFSSTLRHRYGVVCNYLVPSFLLRLAVHRTTYPPMPMPMPMPCVPGMQGDPLCPGGLIGRKSVCEGLVIQHPPTSTTSRGRYIHASYICIVSRRYLALRPGVATGDRGTYPSYRDPGLCARIGNEQKRLVPSAAPML